MKMNKLFFKRTAIAAFFSVTAIISYSCVNEEYDLSQGVDMDMTLLQNTTIPLGNVSAISINTLLGDTGSESSLFSTDKNGNLSLSFGNDVLSQTFKMPKVEIGGEGGLEFKQHVTVEFEPKYKNIPLKGLSFDGVQEVLSKMNVETPDAIHFSEENEDNIIERQFDIELHKELPEQIKDIDIIKLESMIKYNFKVSEGAILHLAAGFTIEFPEFMHISKNEESEDYRIEDNKVVFDYDTRISYDSPLTLNIGFNEMDIPEGSIQIETDADGNEKRFITVADAAVKGYGDLYMKPADYTEVNIPNDNLIMTMDIELDDLVMKSAHVKLDMDVQIENKKIAIGELPEMFTGDGTVVDLYNPIFRIRLDNGSPLELDLNAGISAYSENHTTDIHVGDYCLYENPTTQKVIVPSMDDVEYFFSRQGKHDSSKGEDIGLEHLGDIISEVPDSIVIHDIHVRAEDRFIDVEADEEYEILLEYEFFSPLAFGKDLTITFGYDIDLGLDQDSMGLDSLVLAMNMLNSIPLDFNIKGVALDVDGNELKDASVDMDLDLSAGTIDEPVPSPVEVVISADNSHISISKLRLMLTADAPENDKLVGKSLNTSQGLGINDLHITIPQGISLDLTNSENE